MERRTDLINAEKIMGKNFIGPEQLESIKEILGIKSPFDSRLQIPIIPFDKATLEKYSNEYVLVLGIHEAVDNKPLTINKLRSVFGIDPSIKEPCFYNQDWYLKEKFADETTMGNKWYLLKKNVFEEYRCLNPNEFNNSISKLILPKAILCTFIFFSYYFISDGEILWGKDFVWCSDIDSNSDQIYVGRYFDLAGLNKNGFNIHRFLTIKNNYSYLNIME